jgi:hypothetical protein
MAAERRPRLSTGYSTAGRPVEARLVSGSVLVRSPPAAREQGALPDANRRRYP